MHTDLGIVILTRNDTLSDEQIRTAALRSFPFGEQETGVYVLRCAGKERIRTLNAFLARHADDADRFAVLDADTLPTDAPAAALQTVQTMHADVCCLCVRAPKQASFDKLRELYIRCLCDRCVFWLFSEKAVRRMRTADTVDPLQETLADGSISVAVAAYGNGGAASGLSDAVMRICGFCTLRRFLFGCGGVSLAASIVFLILLVRDRVVLHAWEPVCAAGCIICFHLFLFSVGALLIRWYRGSVRLEQKKREHSYVEESHLQ